MMPVIDDCFNSESEETENVGNSVSLDKPCIFRRILHRSRKGRTESAGKTKRFHRSLPANVSAVPFAYISDQDLNRRNILSELH